MDISETKVILPDRKLKYIYALKNCSSTGDRIPDERQWFYFIFVSLGSYFSLLLLGIIYLLIKSKFLHVQQAVTICYF